MSDTLSPEQKSIGVGMAVAAGIVMSCWGMDVIAAEILSAAGLRTVRTMRETGVDRYDIRLCIPVLKQFLDEDRRRAARAGAP